MHSQVSFNAPGSLPECSLHHDLTHAPGSAYLQDLDTYNKAAVAVAKKYFAISDIDDFYKKKDARPLMFCHFARSISDKTYDEVCVVMPERNTRGVAFTMTLPACVDKVHGVAPPLANTSATVASSHCSAAAHLTTTHPAHRCQLISACTRL